MSPGRRRGFRTRNALPRCYPSPCTTGSTTSKRGEMNPVGRHTARRDQSRSSGSSRVSVSPGTGGRRPARLGLRGQRAEWLGQPANRDGECRQAVRGVCGLHALTRSARLSRPTVSGSGNQWQVKISPGSADPNSPAFQSANRDCHDLLPNGGKPASGADDLAQDLTFADCMRSHGVPSFPDADRDGAFTLPSTINQQAPQFEHASQACLAVQPSSSAINQAPPGR